jgi:hypothetical protein
MMLSFPEEDGFYCIQILVLPKEKSINDVGVFLELKSIFTLKNPIDKTINTKAIEIKTPQDFDFSLYIVCFKIQQDLESPFVFAMAQDPKKPPFAPVHKKKTNK